MVKRILNLKKIILCQMLINACNSDHLCYCLESIAFFCPLLLEQDVEKRIQVKWCIKNMETQIIGLNNQFSQFTVKQVFLKR